MEFPRNVSSRWVDTIAGFDFEVRCPPGKEHTDIDYLSGGGANQKYMGRKEDSFYR